MWIRSNNDDWTLKFIWRMDEFWGKDDDVWRLNYIKIKSNEIGTWKNLWSLILQYEWAILHLLQYMFYSIVSPLKMVVLKFLCLHFIFCTPNFIFQEVQKTPVKISVDTQRVFTLPCGNFSPIPSQKKYTFFPIQRFFFFPIARFKKEMTMDIPFHLFIPIHQINSPRTLIYWLFTLSANMCSKIWKINTGSQINSLIFGW